MRFVCDSTMGKLARFLRMAGFDTAYVREDNMARVLALSKEENRLIVSRNSKYLGLQLASNFYHLTADEPLDQFRKLVTDLQMQLDEKQFLTRCLQCNELLEKIATEKVSERLYDFVARTQPEIFVCPRCDKLYWHATHARAMITQLLALKSELDRKPDSERT
ncbi:MAG: hypothetical protein E4G91_01055 [Candidatus Zixiibacteriota bacterium]|nr:MAG: hypothetical protein E4G91_01055 [candidate division Zixibacteria bacterium]